MRPAFDGPASIQCQNLVHRFQAHEPVVDHDGGAALRPALSDLLTQGHAYLVKRNASPNGAVKPGAQLVGWYEQKTPVVYLLTNASLALARDYWLKVGEGFDIRLEGLWREMEQAGLIASRDDRQFTRKLWMGREFGNQRVLVLDDNKLEVLAGVGLWPRGELSDNGA